MPDAVTPTVPAAAATPPPAPAANEAAPQTWGLFDPEPGRSPAPKPPPGVDAAEAAEAAAVGAPPEETVETPPEAAAPPPPAPPEEKPEPVSPRMAALLKQQRELTRAQEEMKKQREALDAEKAALQKRQALKQEDVLEWLREEGFSEPEAFFQAVLQGKAAPKKVPAPAESPEVKKLREDVEALRREREEERQRAADTFAAELRQGLTSALKATPDKYKHVAAFEAEDTAFSLIEHVARTEKRLLPFEEALGLVEASLAKKAARLQPQVATGNMPAVAPPKPKSEEQPASVEGRVREAPRTLSPSLATSSPEASFEPRTDEEYQAQAAALLRGLRLKG